MQISIANYRNIERLGITIEDGKVNYLFGVCGSGKTSILDAISKPIEPRDTTVGNEAVATTVLVNGQPPETDRATIYSVDRQGVLFAKSASEDTYRVFVGSEIDLQAHETAFLASIESLREIKGKLVEFRGNVDDLGKQLGKPGKSGKFTKAAKVCKAHEALAIASERARKTVDGHEIAYLEWQAAGFTINGSFAKGECPFCGQIIPDERMASLEEVRTLTLKDLKPIFTSSTLMSDLGFKNPEYADEDGFAQLKDRLERLFKARGEIDRVIQYCNIGRGTELLNGVPQGIEIDEVAYEFVPELKELVEDVQDRRAELSKLMGQMAADLKKMVGTNARSLNSKLSMLGIPYAFEIGEANRDDRKATYVLRHVRGKQGDDMRELLSYGEKNLIALLLFLHNNDSELTLIDDPASSYDDFRRSQIYRCIMEHRGKTVLVVSHDQAFVRRAVADADSVLLGRISFLEHASHGCRIMPITRDSFVFIDDEIRRRIASADGYYQKMVNVRLYCDIHKHEISEAAWGYTSAILHGATRDAVQVLLQGRGVCEQDVLDEICCKLNCDIQTMPRTIDRSISTSFTDYEVLIVAREYLALKKASGSLTSEDALNLTMLNDLVHMNDCALFCLNPYEYSTWPSVFSALLEEYRTV